MDTTIPKAGAPRPLRRPKVRQPVPLSEAAQVLVVRNHGRDFERQRTGAAAVQDTVEAVSVTGYGEQRLALAARVVELPAHLEERVAIDAGDDIVDRDV